MDEDDDGIIFFQFFDEFLDLSACDWIQVYLGFFLCKGLSNTMPTIRFDSQAPCYARLLPLVLEFKIKSKIAVEVIAGLFIASCVL